MTLHPMLLCSLLALQGQPVEPVPVTPPASETAAPPPVANDQHAAPTARSLDQQIDDIRILPAENRGVWDEGPFPLRVVGEEFSHCTNERIIMGIYRTEEFGGWPGWKGIAMAGPDDQNNPDYARTCEQWVALGAVPRDNMNNKIGQTLKAAEATLSFLMVAQPSPHSRLANQDLRRILLPLVPPPVERERLERSPDPINTVSLRGASLGRETEGWRAHAELRAFGDVDGDGWEDMLIERYDGATRATYSETQLLTYTMHESGHPIPLWNRVPQYMPSAEAWAARKARWAANLGLPVDRPIELRGTCSCHLDQEQHAMTLVVQARTRAFPRKRRRAPSRRRPQRAWQRPRRVRHARGPPPRPPRPLSSSAPRPPSRPRRPPQPATAAAPA